MEKSSKSILLLLALSLLLIMNSFSVLALKLDTVNDITLLSVTENSDGTQEGDLAYLTLKIREGEGAVFLDSFPATRIDTQVSARMANEIACTYTDVDCSKYDFFYTINAGAATIGGPSAGGAITILTLSSLEEVELKDGLAVTGAISSGGILMPVDGIKAKVLAAQDEDYSLVIIPKLALSKERRNKTNISFFREPLLREDFENYTIKIVEVISFQEAFQTATKDNYVFPKASELIVPDEYFIRMEETANQLCERTDELYNELNEKNETKLELINNYMNLSKVAKEKGELYSRASFCYSANTNLRIMLLENFTQELLLENYNRLNESHKDFSEKVNRYDLKTFSDLETYSIVRERLLESKTYLNSLDLENISSQTLALAIERYYSAVVWSSFFGMGGEELNLNQEAIRNACEGELQNVYTRNNYLQTFMPPQLLIELFQEIAGVRDYINKGEYELCLFKASKAKANADYLITGATLNNDTIIELIDEKQKVALELIASQQEINLFPILGYSYYGYSQSLEDDSYYSALMFAENSIAFSDLSKYFEKKDKGKNMTTSFVVKTYSGVLLFILGCFVGLTIGMFMFGRKKAQGHKKHKKRKG